ncbi:4'-phosphopantetheinyl transferase superfamily protein [Aeromicrobium sp. 50.2.37]|uniref:4'-phosphopantetheinyl transferase family protein n=1 Tax=Aeromicrobium sp. 50.2.37 TaxID=2969305 RepID=UPI002150435B|nr:4'-phosphopantetheinyl transferase superfamily protein [Aeromicrobium sp. 50.2.37]MCR4514912.1 4'-phosphopantetheinyl transferase superfamily protein [Aeromicrobium sp. 50.2.37]
MRVDLWWAAVAPGEQRPGQQLLERAAAERLGRPGVEVVRTCPSCGSSSHGRPVSPGEPALGLSLAHAGGLALVAVVQGARVGVDLELLGTDVEHLADVALGPRDAPAPTPSELLRTWTRKEAVLKAVGVGLAVDPSELAVSGAHDPAELVSWSVVDVADPRPVHLVDLGPAHGVPAGVVASLAVTGTSRGPDVVVRSRSAGP